MLTIIAQKIAKELMPHGFARRLLLAKERKEAHERRASFYQKFLEENDLVFDVGANVGERTSALLAVGCRVVAIEPQPDCCKKLRNLEARNGRLTVLQVACGRAEGSANLRTGGGGDVLASLSNDYIQQVKASGRFARHEWKETVPVSLCSLDMLINRYGVPKYIKIDVEGYELEVFAGMTANPAILSFEYTPETAQVMIQCLEHCERLGLKEFNISWGESMRFSLDQWVTIGRIKEMVQILDGDSYLFGDIFARRQ